MDSDEKSSENLHYSQNEDEVTGLRSKRLLAMLICVFILFLLTLLILLLNVLIIVSLRMDSNGIPFLRFYQTVNRNNQLEKTVEMGGDRIEFEKVLTSRVNGFPDKDILVQAPRILISAKPNDSVFAINEKLCKMDNVNNFQVVSPNGRTLFSARHPIVTIDNRIKKLAAEKIITNKVRSAVDEPLKITGGDIVLRGNEQVRIDARNVNLEGMSRIAFNISRDGILHIRGKLRLGDGTTSLPMSTSPSLSASLDGLRLCACATFNHKLFLVPANKHCNAQHTFC